MPGPVFRGAEAAPSAVWKDGTLFDRDGVTPLLGQIRGGWGVGASATTAWRVQGNVVLKGSSSAPFCRVAQTQVLKGNSYEVLYRLMGDGITRANGREVVARGPGLSPEELMLAALVFDKA